MFTRKGLCCVGLAVLFGLVGCTTYGPFVSLSGVPQSINQGDRISLTASGGPGSSKGLWFYTFSSSCGGTFEPVTIGPTNATTVQVIYDSTEAAVGPCTITVRLTTASGRSASASVNTTIIQTFAASGVLAVSDAIENIGDIDLDRIEDPLYRNENTVIWRIIPSLRPHGDFPTYHLEGLDFYAKLQGNSLSILINGDEAQALRGMIPSLEWEDNLALSLTPDLEHFCYPYNATKTLIYRVLQQAFDELREKGVIAPGSSLAEDPVYYSTFTDTVFIFGYYITAAEFDANSRSFHNWPWGSGTDECRYFPGSFICEYTDGIVEVRFNFNLSQPTHYYAWGWVYNDNGEETIYLYNGEEWLHQVNWARPHYASRYGTDFPSDIRMWLRKVWSVAEVRTWMAIAADSVTVEGWLRGQGPTLVDIEEEPDVLVPISVIQQPLQWP